jgi:DnaJ-like protein
VPTDGWTDGTGVRRVLDRHESLVDRQIRLAAERGAFENLPGRGKPLPGLQGPDDELWWVRGYLEREGLSSEALLPPSIQLRKEVDRLPETLRELPTEQAVREVVRELNLRIVEFLRAPTGPRVHVGRIDVDEAVRRWAQDRGAPRTSAAAPVSADPAPTPSAPTPSRSPRRRWWARRWWGPQRA